MPRKRMERIRARQSPGKIINDVIPRPIIIKLPHNLVTFEQQNELTSAKIALNFMIFWSNSILLTLSHAWRRFTSEASTSHITCFSNVIFDTIEFYSIKLLRKHTWFVSELRKLAFRPALCRSGYDQFLPKWHFLCLVPMECMPPA